MPGITACTMEQAKAIAGMRPFENVDDMTKKLRKKKGVSSAIFEQYRDIMRGYAEVDRVLTKCEKHGAELSRTMRIWIGTAVSSDPTTSTASPPLLDSGVHLVEMSPTAIAAGLQPSASEEVKKAFKGFITEQPEAVPESVVLKPYQMLGINWLNLLYGRGTSCILADEMGLGKTATTISFLAHLKQTGAPGPHLIIVPASTLDNWLREFDVFAPSLIVEPYWGSQAERSEQRHNLKLSMAEDDLDVVVTTYNIATSSIDDRKFLDKAAFRTCTYDEGHQLKNSESKKYKDLMRIQIPWRLLLTGTPLQNNLQELVSLLSFILPSIFNSARDDLRAIFKVPADAQANLLSQQRITRAKKMMTPFVLRRKKAQVLRDLPKKIERIEFCEMSTLQRQVYREALQRSKKALSDPDAVLDVDGGADDGGEDEEGGKKGKKGAKKATTKSGAVAKENSSSNVLMELRKASNHPMLFRRLYDDKKIKLMARDCLRELEFHDRNSEYIFEDMEIMTDFELHQFAKQYKSLNKYALKKNEWMQAGKIEALKRMLPDMKANGDRVLIFSQFTMILRILEKVLDTMGIRYLQLTGSTPVGERQGLVDEYSSDPDITVFCLNLMAANTVIIHDQDFNPHNDRQAEDRAYRLGQKRDVSVIKLITRGTIEEDILQLAQTKIALDASVSSGANGALPAVPLPDGTVLPAGEGNEAQTEKAVKVSLMAKLKKRFNEEEEGSEGSTSTSEPVPVVPTTGKSEV